jgi:hypothetical protein
LERLMPNEFDNPLASVQFAHILTYLAPQGPVEEWAASLPKSIESGGDALEVSADVRPLGKTVLALCHFRASAQRMGPTRAAEVAIDLLNKAPAPPEAGLIGQSVVLLAEANRSVQEECAQAFLSAISEDDESLVLTQGGSLRESRDVTLWHDGEGGGIVLLSHPTEGPTAARLSALLGQLRFVEMWWHQIRHEHNAYEEIRKELEQRKKALQSAVDELFKDLGQPFLMTNQRAMDSAMRDYQSAATAYRAMNKVTIQARQSENRIASYRANLEAATCLLGPTARQVVEGKLLDADLAIQQVQFDLAMIGPVLEAARWASDQHRAQLLNGLASFEQQKTIWFAVIGAALGILNIWAAATLPVPISDRALAFWGILWPSALIGSLAAVYWYFRYKKAKFLKTMNEDKK